MKVLILALNYHPELIGVGKYTGELAEWLTARGHGVRVVTAPPYYPAWRLGPGHASSRYRAERVGRADVLRCPLWVPKVPSALKRILHLASFALSSAVPALWRAIAGDPTWSGRSSRPSSRHPWRCSPRGCAGRAHASTSRISSSRRRYSSA